jgi:hypothetical protein
MSRAERVGAVPSWGAARQLEGVPHGVERRRVRAVARDRVRLAPPDTALRDGVGLVLAVGGTVALWAAFLAAVS